MDRNFSIYQEVFKQVEAEKQNLSESVSDDVLGANSLKYETSIPVLERMCYIMESVLLRNKSDAIVYAGFQKYSRAEAIWNRYLEMADNVEKIYLFGVPDIKLKSHPNIEFVHLKETDELFKEWFLLIYKKIGKSMMTAQDQDGFGKHEDEKRRVFKGVKSTDPKLVTELKEKLDKAIKS